MKTIVTAKTSRLIPIHTICHRIPGCTGIIIIVRIFFIRRHRASEIFITSDHIITDITHIRFFYYLLQSGSSCFKYFFITFENSYIEVIIMNGFAFYLFRSFNNSPALLKPYMPPSFSYFSRNQVFI